MRIIIKNMTGIETVIEVSPSETINDGKKKYDGNIGRIWIFDGETLDGTKTFSDYEIDENETIIATNKVIGGLNK